MITINVTQEHIDKGFQDDCKNCPTALAINVVLKEGAYSIVRMHRVAIATTDFQYVEYLTPLAVSRFISRFDGGIPVKPFNFSMVISKELLKEEYRAEIERCRRNDS